ncbi:MAG: hypothetical protein IKT42_03765, partial [Clostridia bacterium]|nr:hypothetical protein [Clostridia bacterium]
QKRSNFCLPKVTSFFIQAAGLAYHHALACISSPQGVYHHRRCILLQLDDIPQQVADDMQNFVLMIYNGKPLICFLKCGIMRLKGVFIWQKITC